MTRLPSARRRLRAVPLSTTALVAALLLAHAGAARAAPPGLSASHDFRLPANPLAATLNRIAAQAGLVISVAPALVDGRQAPAIDGRLSARQAFERALEGQGLSLGVTGSGALTVQPAAGAAAAASAPVASLAPVQVSATGERATTEHTGAYTARAVTLGKGEQSLREIPNAVSVVTRQVLEDQNAVALADTMRYVTGMRANATGNGIDNLESRGYILGNYLLDGVPIKSGQGFWGSSLMDVALYDRIEVWRGPTGLLEGAGEPSGTLNLVRKRADGVTAIQAAATVGSWNTRRAEFDITGPLNARGDLRGRLVAVADNRHSFVDYITLGRNTLYGTVEYDFTPATTLSVGMTEQRGRSLMYAGLPLLADGRGPDVDRSTFIGSVNAGKRDYTHRYFAELEHRLDQGGRLRVNVNRYLRGTALNRFSGNSFLDPVTRQVAIDATLQRAREDDKGIDAYLSLPGEWRGLKQVLVLGAHYQTYQGGQIQRRAGSFSQNIDNPDVNLPLPVVTLGPVPATQVTQYGSYAQARIKPWQPVTVIVGGRLAWWETHDPAAPAGNQSVKSKFVPTLGVVADITPELSLYGSVNRIFAPQNARSVDNAFLAPRSGRQVEVGIKGEFLDRRVNAHLAAFRIQDTNRAVSDPDNLDFSIAAGEVRSQGVEAEISGRMTPSWDLTAGYAYTESEYRSDTLNQQGQPFNSAFPRHNLSLWTKYRLPRWAGTTLGGGLRAVSDSATRYGNTTWTQPAYAVVSLQGSYAITPAITASLTVNNLFDRNYFERLAGGTGRQTYFGEPRSFMVSLRARF